MKTQPKLIIILILMISLTKASAQLDLSHELGFTGGAVIMQTDYGERNHLPSSTPTSFGVAFVHYLSFYGNNYNWRNGASFFSDHFKLRTELSYYFTNNFEHKGAYIQPQNEFAQKMRAMSGSTKMYNIGMQLEYYFKNLEDYGLLFNNGDKFSPYVSLGAQYSAYTPDVNSSLGDFYQDPTILPTPWQENAVFEQSDNVFSFVMSAGTRYQLGDDLDLVGDVRWQYFFSDKIEGLDAPRDISGSRFNDTLLYFSVGLAYDLSGLSR